MALVTSRPAVIRPDPVLSATDTQAGESDLNTRDVVLIATTALMAAVSLLCGY